MKLHVYSEKSFRIITATISPMLCHYGRLAPVDIRLKTPRFYLCLDQKLDDSNTDKLLLHICPVQNNNVTTYLTPSPGCKEHKASFSLHSKHRPVISVSVSVNGEQLIELTSNLA